MNTLLQRFGYMIYWISNAVILSAILIAVLT